MLSLLALARACSTAALCNEDIISNLSPAFDSIPELCTVKILDRISLKEQYDEPKNN